MAIKIKSKTIFIRASFQADTDAGELHDCIIYNFSDFLELAQIIPNPKNLAIAQTKIDKDIEERANQYESKQLEARQLEKEKLLPTKEEKFEVVRNQIESVMNLLSPEEVEEFKNYLNDGDK